jgi:DNA polymerase-1
MLKEETNKILESHDLVTQLGFTVDYTDKKAVKALAKELAKAKLKDHFLNKNKKEDISYDYIPLEIMAPYAAADVHYTWRLYKQFILELCEDSGLKDLYKNELKFLKVLVETERLGMKIDTSYLGEVGPRLDKEASTHQAKIFSHLGYEFNLKSSDEMVKALQKVGVRLTKLTKGSKKNLEEGKEDAKIQFCVDEEVLSDLALKHPFANDVLAYRKVVKTKGTYVDGLIEAADPQGFVHCNFNQGVKTGRLSCSNPNLQNIPTADKTIKRAFTVPDESYVLVMIDYSQAELRCGAHVSQDPLLMSCYPWEGEGVDVHLLTTANVVLNRDIEEVKLMAKDYTGHDDKLGICECPACFVGRARRTAKVVNFGIFFGVSSYGLQRQASSPGNIIPVEKCQEYIDNFFETYRGVKELIQSTSNFLRKNGYVQNAFLRYRRFPNVNRMQKWEFQRAVRQAVNFLEQGTCADLFKIASVRIDELLRKKKAKTKLVNFVHDEILFYWHKDELDLISEIKGQMEDFDFSVPIVTEVSYSLTNWAEKKPWKGKL